MNSNQRKQEIVENYIQAYNHFDIKGMLHDLHNDIQFENISNGQANLTTHGIEEFRNQAESAKKLFKKREQKITTIKSNLNSVEVQIDYTGILAVDLPDGLKKRAAR
jgi:hypothetical protein